MDKIDKEKNQELSDETPSLQDLIQDIEFWRNKSVHLAADFENFKKRTAKDFEFQREALYSKVFGDLLSMADDLDRACYQSIAQMSDAHALQSAVSMINASLHGIFKKCGIEEINTSGQFDPQFHEAVAHVEQEDVASGSIVTVIHKGYLLGDKVLRPALVTVAK